MAKYQLHPLLSDFSSRLESLCNSNHEDVALELIQEFSQTLQEIVTNWDYGKMNNIPELQVWRCDTQPIPIHELKRYPILEVNCMVQAAALVLPRYSDEQLKKRLEEASEPTSKASESSYFES